MPFANRAKAHELNLDANMLLEIRILCRYHGSARQKYPYSLIATADFGCGWNRSR